MLVTPAAKKRVVQVTRDELGYSQRRPCRLARRNRTSARRFSTRLDAVRLRERLRELARQRMRWSYRMLDGVLRLEGWNVNHKRIHRIYKMSGSICGPNIDSLLMALVFEIFNLIHAMGSIYSSDISK